MSKEREKGTRFESATAEYLTLATGQKVTRRALAGSNDRGDLQGLRVNGEECVVECKNCNKIEVSKWLKEARREAANADADFGVVVFHIKGVGLNPISMNDQGVLMDLDTFARLVDDGTSGAGHATDPTVVRCRDCKHSYNFRGLRCGNPQWHDLDESPEVYPDGFCFLGERGE